MASDLHRHELPLQAAALRDAVVRAGPDTQVPTCPEWDVRKLVRHLGRVYAMVSIALDSAPDAERPEPPRPPEEFDEALSFMDAQFAELVATLSTMDQDRPVWSFFPGGTPASWLRRMAHETAIHRLDAEHALASVGPDHVHDLLFDPAFAADGVDEMLTSLLPVLRDWSESEWKGHVLYHAPDAGRAWMVGFRPGQLPEVGVPHSPALNDIDVDATVAGTADALYRRVWGRPSTAMVSGHHHDLAGIIAGR